MVEKKRSLTVSTAFTDFGDLDEKKKDDIKKYFPIYFSDDLEYMKEECEEGIQELRRAIDEIKDDDRLQNYIIAKATVMRNQCPYQEISDIYDRFILELKGKYPTLDYIDKPRYSLYFPNKTIPSLRAVCKALEENQPAIPDVLTMKTTTNEELSNTLKSIYNFYHGRIPRSEQLLLYYPDYMTRFSELQRILMTEDGPLPPDQRYFLALMSVSCFGCDYLYNLLVEGYVEAGGDMTWLDANSTTLPNKLKRVIETNYDLAYQPWMFIKEKQHQLAGLLKEPDAWSRLELMQVLLIFSFYHSFCCYVYTMGILPELDFPRDAQKDFYLRADDDTWKSMMKNSPLMRTTNQDILEELDKLAKKSEEEEKEDKKNDPPTSEKADDSVDYGEDLSFEGFRNNSIYYKFFGERKIEFSSTKQKRLDSNIYEWKIHGYSVLDEHFPEIAKCIDAKYDYIHALTLGSFGEKEGVQTQPFRKALDYYIQCIHGYEHMDFDYQMINKMIHKDLKLAIKTIGSTPQNLNFGIINRFPAGFKTFEFCHVALIVMASNKKYPMDPSSNNFIYHSELQSLLPTGLETDPQTPLGTLNKLVSDFTQIQNIQSFKDLYKRLRKHLKENPVLYKEHQAQGLLSALALSLCRESTLGTITDIKGLINDLLEAVLAHEEYTQEVPRVFEESIVEFLESIPHIKLEGLGKAGGTMSLQQVDDHLKILNQFGELLPVMAKHCPKVLGFLLGYYIEVLEQFADQFENNKYHSAQYLTVLNFVLRGCCTLVLNFKDAITQAVEAHDTELITDLMTISLCSRVFLSAISSLNPKCVSQSAILAVLIDSNLLKVSDQEFEAFHLQLSDTTSPFTVRVFRQTEENLKRRRLVVIQSLILFKEGFDIFKNFETLAESAFSIILNSCDDSNAHVRHTAFRTLQGALESVSNNDKAIRRFFEKGRRYHDIFELLMKNWESSVKGMTQTIEVSFATLLKIIDKSRLDDKNRVFYDLENHVMALGTANVKKRYGTLVLLCEYIDVQYLLDSNKRLIYELLTANQEVYVASSIELVEKLLARLHTKISAGNPNIKKEERFQKWSQYWVKDFMTCLENEEFNVVKGIILHIIPTVQKIDALSCGHLLQLLSNKDQTKNNYLWCYVSLLKLARANNLLDYSADKKGYTFRGSLDEYNSSSHIDGSYLQKLLLSGNRNVILNMLELLTTSPKPADIPTPFEYNLVLTSLRYNLRTSNSDTRNNTITVFKKFLNRLRKIYESTLLHYFPAHASNFKDLDLQKLEAEAKKPYKAGFTNMISFLKATITSLIENLIPEVEFETIYPVLELLKLIFQIFGLNNSRKNNLKGTAILQYLEIYNINLFNTLLVSFKSAWESVRVSSCELLLEFPDNYDIITPEYLNRTLLPSALELTKNPILKNAEGGALLLNLVAQKFVDKVDFSLLENGSQGVPAAASSLKFSYYILNLLESRLEKVKTHFLEDQTQFSNNLFHGLITTLRFLVQSILPKSSENPQNRSEYRTFFTQLTQVIGRILCYTSKVTSDDLISSILSFDRSAKDLDASVQVDRTTATDCRGHFITEKTAQMDEAAKLRVENIFTDDAEENIPAEAENINVIAFYLIAKESGLLLQTISDILPKLDEQNGEIIDLNNVRTLVTIYFHALLNLKHLGALDSIAQGLSIFAKNFHAIKSPELSRLGEDLLTVLLNSLRQGDFRNILRRSSGIPQAIICVLKTEPYGQKGLLFPRTMTELLDLAENGFTDEIKIHALNVLKFIFRDSTLKSDIEAYISRGLIIAIRGFSSNDWMIRNSSLMLFSSIAKRTVGAEKIADEQSNRSNLTILEFFTRAPELADFFLNEVQQYIDSIEQENHKESLYPSLYPIALLMSRLLPYDTKKGSTHDKGEDEEIEGEEAAQSGQTEELVAKIERFLPLFVQAAHNKNYMGRLMCAKAVVSLIKQKDISNHVMELLELDHISQRRVLKTDHNYGHGLLLQIYYLLKNHFDIQENSSSTSEKTAFNQNFSKLVNKISDRRLFLIYNTCPFITTVYLQILKKIIKHNQDHDLVQYGEIFAYAYGYSVQMLREECKNKTFRLSEDFGHSILRLKYLQYALIFDRVVNKDFEGHKTLLQLFVEKYRENLSERKTDDNELFKTLLIYFNKQLTLLGPSALTSDDKKTVLSHLNTLLGQPDFICHEFVSCITEILNIILNMEGYIGLPPYQASLLIDQLNTLYAKFPQNTKLMEVVIQLYGAVLPVYLNSGAVWDKNKVLSTYNAICEKYSQAAQVDFLRIAVVQSLKLSFATVMDSKNIQDFGIFLDFSRVIIRLLQDEIPEIRSKIANHVSRAFRLSEGQAQFKFNANYILEKYFEYIVLKFEGPSSVTSPKGYNVGQLVENSYGLSGNNPLLLAQFLLSYIFESEFDKYSEMDHLEKRIYAVEKPNKFYNAFLVQKVAYAVLIKLMSRQAISRYIIEDSIKNKNYKFNLVSQKELEKYTADVLGRNEFLYECILRKVYQENIVPGADRANNQFLQGLKHDIGTLEIYLKNLVENSLN